MDGWTDGTIDARKDGRTERRKLYPPQHTSYAGDIMNGYVLYTESTDLFKKKKKTFQEHLGINRTNIFCNSRMGQILSTYRNLLFFVIIHHHNNLSLTC